MERRLDELKVKECETLWRSGRTWLFGCSGRQNFGLTGTGFNIVQNSSGNCVESSASTSSIGNGRRTQTWRPRHPVAANTGASMCSSSISNAWHARSTIPDSIFRIPYIPWSKYSPPDTWTNFYKFPQCKNSVLLQYTGTKTGLASLRHNKPLGIL